MDQAGGHRGAGRLATRKAGSGAKPKLTAAQRARVLAWADATPRATTLLPTANLQRTGSNWLQLVSYQTTTQVADLIARTFGRNMHAVQGKWGSGRVYSSGVVSVLVTKKAQLFAGAVRPSVLYEAARQH